MGCFAAACGLSGLGIGWNDKVKFVLLKQNRSNGHLLHPEGHWGIFTTPFNAKYNDYGTVEDWDPNDPNFIFAMQTLRRRLIERPVGKNEYHDVPVSAKSTDKELFEALWENRVLVRDHDGECEVRPCIIRADVWNLAMKQTVLRGWREKDSLKTANDEVQRGTKALWKAASADINDFEARFSLDIGEPHLFSMSTRYNSPFASNVWFGAFNRTLDKAALESLEYPLSEVLHLTNVLDSLRIALYPSHTIGGQCVSHDSHVNWFKGLATLSSRLKKESDEE